MVRAVAEGDTVETSYTFKLFSLSDRRPGNDDNLWFYSVHDTVRPDKPARLMVGTAADSVTLYYMLFCEDRILEEKVYSVSDTIMDFTYPSVPDGADGMQAVFYLVRDGRCSTREVRLVRPCPERKLRLAWTSFRDRLQPGTEETWRLRVTLPDGRPAPAQLMATLYDTSLDAIKPHGWNFYQHFFPSLPSVRMGMTNWFGSNYIVYAARVPYTVAKPLRFDYFNPAMLAWGGLRTVEEVLNITDNTVVVGMSPGSGRIAGLDMA